MAEEMNELLTEMKKQTDECKEQIQELDSEQNKVF
jgi:transposase